MSIHLAEYLTGNQSVRENAAMRAASDISDAAARSGQDAIALKQGEHIRGIVAETDGNRVLIESKDHGLFLAQIENGMRVEKGDVLDFEVRGMLGKQIALTPLYSNMSANSSVLKALEAAALPVTDANVRMVGEMMKQGMGIDRGSLHSMAGLIGRFSGYDPSLIVQMKQMGIPISEENVMQAEICRNNEAQIQNSFAEISGQMQSLMKEMAANGEYEALGRLFTETARLFLQPQETEGAIREPAGDGGNAQDLSVGAEQTPADKETKPPAGDDAAGEAVQGQNAARDAEPFGNANETTVSGGAQGGYEPQESAGLQNESAAQGSGTVQGQTVQTAENPQSAGIAQEGEIMPARGENPSAENAGADFVQTQNTQDAPGMRAFWEHTAAPAGQNAAQGVQEHDYRRAGAEAARLMKQPGFAEEFQNMLTQKWMLTPQQTADKEQVRRLYENVLRQTKQLLELLSDAGKQNSSAAKSLQNMEKNVDFLNELSQQFAYVQLPLKMSQQNAHGDLYVYAKKRRLTGADDTVTAFLHLGMDHLGEMDIYVALSQNKVSTRFYLENESIIDFMEEHMDELNERLGQKGYLAQTQVLPKEQEEKKSVFEVMLGDSISAGAAPPVMLSHRSFDARA